MSLKSSLKNYINTLKTSRDVRNTGVVFTGNLVFSVLGLVVSILIMRNMGPGQYGYFTISIAFMGIIINLMDFGIGLSGLKFATGETEETHRSILGVTLIIKLTLGAIVGFAVLLLSPLVASKVYHNEALLPFVMLAVLGAFGSSLLSFANSYSQSLEKFYLVAMLKVNSVVFRIAGVGALLYFNRMAALLVFLVYMLEPFAASLPAFIWNRKELDFKILPASEVVATGRKILHLGGWITFSGIFATFFSRLDILMLGYFKQMEQVGIYGAAWNLAYSPTIILTGAIVTVAAPYLTKKFKNEPENVSRVLYKLNFSCFALGVCFVPFLMIFDYAAIIYFLKSYYLQAFPLAMVLTGSLMASFGGIGIGYYFFLRNEYHYPVIVNLIQLILSFTANLILIPKYSAIGAAVATTATSIAGLGIYYLIISRKTGNYTYFLNLTTLVLLYITYLAFSKLLP